MHAANREPMTAGTPLAKLSRSICGRLLLSAELYWLGMSRGHCVSMIEYDFRSERLCCAERNALYRKALGRVVARGQKLYRFSVLSEEESFAIGGTSSRFTLYNVCLATDRLGRSRPALRGLI